MKFLTFNLYQYLEPGNYWYQKDPNKPTKNTNTPEQWEEKRTWIRSMLEQTNADVIGFQEVFSKQSLRDLVKNTGYDHFATVEKAGRSSDDITIYNRPIVAIASRLPIVSVSTVAVQPSFRKSLNLSDDFSFSRAPVKAILQTERFGLIQVYIVHLKSKRALYQTDYMANDELEDKVLEEVMGQSKGKIASLIQRGAEASALAADVTIEQRYSELPTVVLGDINCDYRSVEYDSLCPSGSLYPIAGETESGFEDRDKVNEISSRLSLKSAYSAAEEKSSEPTHYHRGNGGTLDYIFLTDGFEKRGGSIREHKVWNRHLKDDEGKPHGDKSYRNTSTDHGLVTLYIEE